MTLWYNLKNYVVLGVIGFHLEGGEGTDWQQAGHLAGRTSPVARGYCRGACVSLA